MFVSIGTVKALRLRKWSRVADLDCRYILLKPTPLKRDRDVRGLDFHAAASNEWEYSTKEKEDLE
ncbi:hypothetical protein KAR91_77125 [Candidatus Pacearchaeota archaeon]|nr:hypothetical protein [Candidatus Pacearchaeota archaeon]